MSILLLVSFLAACESGNATVVDVDVSDAVAADTSESTPGVLVTDAGLSAPGAPLAALCGAALAEPVTYSFDFGFGCLRERSGPTEETVRAWVAPLPEGWDAAAFCALSPTPFSGLDIGPDVTGDHDTGDTGDTADTADTGGVVDDPESGLTSLGLAGEPDPAWPQASAKGTWERDFSPCGGILKVEMTIE